MDIGVSTARPVIEVALHTYGMMNMSYDMARKDDDNRKQKIFALLFAILMVTSMIAYGAATFF